MKKRAQDEKREVVVVTGASAGVGRAIVRELAVRGARIGLIARGGDGLEGAKRDVEELGGEAIILPLDVADADAVEAAAKTVEETFGPIDVWVNNAMVSVFSPVKELRPDEVKRVTEVTYLGVVHGTMAALSRMLPRDHGVIVQIGSALAYRGIPLQAAYCGAKHAIQGFNDSLYAELIHDRSAVRLTMVNLPAVNTPQFDWVKSKLPRRAAPVGEIYQPEIAARAVMWAVDNDRREVNVAWNTTKAIVGNAFFPGYGDTYLADNGYDQMTDEPEDPDRPHNLWAPVPGDHGAHGRFDDRAQKHDWYTKANLHRGWLSRAAAIALGAVAVSLKAAGNGQQRKEKKRAKKKASRLSRDLRRGESKYLKDRRGIVGLSALASASMGFIALYQMGIIRHLPEPPLPMMDADKVDASAEAYERFSMPDAVLGLGSYAATMSLAAMGGPDRYRTMPWVPLALGAKVAFDAANAGKLTLDQWTKHKAFCFWCLLAAGATFATVPLVVRELRAAGRAMTGKTAELE
ncbi:MAG: SDR family NAD(P)-dependent oxidoreductase [Acidobacteria bacterium]|nr:SDR family NAD(P)-dependent oxidoreductase [Acidobacteriota bacterium]